MKTRLLNLWERLRTSLWFVPTCMSAAAVALAVLATRGELELRGDAAWLSRSLLYSGDIEGARLLLSTIAGSMITVAGVTFSVTMVALSQASSQLGPRLLLNFMNDRGNQLVLGSFIATFLFCLIALASISKAAAEHIPAVSVTIAVLLAFVNLGFLIYFIHHASSSIHADHVVQTVARELEQAVDRAFPPGLEEETRDDAPPPPSEAEVWARAPSSGYVQAIDEASLVELAERSDALLRTPWRPGHFVVEGEALALADGAATPPDGASERARQAFILGRLRTHEQDPEYGVRQLVEVAVRALSPGINDPYTAMTCIDWLAAVLCRIGARPARSAVRRGGGGRPRLVTDPITFEGVLAAAFDQIRQNAGRAPAVSIRLLEALARIAPHLAQPSRRKALRSQADMVVEAAREAGLQDRDRRDLDARHQAVVEALDEEPAQEIGAAC